MARYIPKTTQSVLLNPLPAVTEKELADRMGFYWPRASTKRAVFRMEGRFCADSEESYKGGSFSLEPGEEVIENTAFAKEIFDQLKDNGCVLINPGDDRETAILDGLERARQNFRSFGREPLAKIAALGNHSKEQMETLKESFFGYHLNQAKEDFVEEEIKRFRSKAQKVSKA